MYIERGVILKCIFSSLPSTRPFGSSLASGSVGTPKLSKKVARALLGWVTHWEVTREFPKTKPGVILKCIFPSLPSTRPFRSLLASGSVGTAKLSEKVARALLGWVTHWKVAREFLETKP
ncbi:hypothetical protein DVH24_002289 [Malus domestica]|uniref:Uncharacterized protein n=1 Tax=Malus domestica TaxID=3750 RepID=A0A498IB26_MALDO|nr:hypothetical protein DVH24_002289 [Malus domestica]